MRREGNVQNVVIVLLVVAVLCMSVGFALSAYTQDLQIIGNVTANKAVWDVKFNTTSYAATSGNGYVTATNTVTGTTVNFDVTLNPGEKHEFTINAENYGTLDAVLQSVTMSSLSADVADFLSYEVYVNNTKYTETTTGLNVALDASDVHPVKVLVSYNVPEDPTKLPSENKTTSLSVTLTYGSVIESAS